MINSEKSHTKKTKNKKKQKKTAIEVNCPLKTRKERKKKEKLNATVRFTV